MNRSCRYPTIAWLMIGLALVPLVLSTPLSPRWEDFETKHAWVQVPKGWEDLGPAPSDHPLELRIALKQDRFDELLTALYEVSDPSHTRYGAHLSKAAVDELIAPHSDTVNLVNAWCAHHGLRTSGVNTTRPATPDWIILRASVAQAGRLLDADYRVFRHTETGERIVRTLSYSLPRALYPHVRVVAPTTFFGFGTRAMRATSFLEPQGVGTADAAKASTDEDGRPGASATVPSSCARTITPACLRALYNTTSYVPQAADRNSIGVAGYLNQFANDGDLQTFFQRFRTDAEGATFTHVQVNGGGNDQNDPGVEANLDIQYTQAITFPTPNIYYSTGGSPPFDPDSNTRTNTNEPYLDWLNFVLAQESVPQTFTTSYGDDEQTVPLDYASAVCDMFATLGSRGSSILFSSGDFGVGGGDCVSNDGTNTVRFQPIFPATCPFVTSVGGTVGINPEVAVSFSGGGFSDYFARPSYQDAAVNTFLNALGSTNKGLFNATGRGFPDVAAQGRAFQVVIGGRTSSVSGTSASSPTFAGIVSLLNDFRIASGNSPLGFLNPMLYSSGVEGLNDITSGTNPGCRTNGFTARTGWDPVTGLGTPDFGKLQMVVEKT